MENLKALVQGLRKDVLFLNSFYLMLSTGCMALCGFIFWVIVAHVYKPGQVGIAATLITSMNFIAYFGLLGFNSTFIRFLPNSKKRSREINTGLLLVACASVLIATLYVIFAPRFASKLAFFQQNAWYDLTFIVLCLCATVNLVTDSIFIAYRSAKYNLLIDGIFGSLSQLLLPIFFIALGAFGIFAAQGLAAFVAMICSIIFLIEYFDFRPKLAVDPHTVKEVFRYSSGNYFANILNVSPTILLPIIILNKLGAPAAGYYYLAFMMANLLFTIAYSVSQALFAEGSYDEEQFHKLIKRGVTILSVIIIPAAIMLAGIGPLVLDLFGHGYSYSSTRTLIVFAASAPFVSAYILGSVILRIKKQIKLLVAINVFYAAAISGLAYLWAGKGLSYVAFAWMAGHAATAVLIFAVLGVLHYQKKYSTRRNRIRLPNVPALVANVMQGVHINFL